jgi:cation diffusion facilitator CzcD-associated flavoprotein CzcO
MIPAGRYSHTCDCVDLADLAGRRCLIVGGRQSAFEWAALLRERGAAAVYVCHRHDTPAFVESDWSWVNPMLAKFAREPAWYRDLADSDREKLNQRFWREGRMKLEPWLAPRLDHPSVELMPNTNVSSCRESSGGALQVDLDNGQMRAVDHVIFATGYKVDMARVPFLSQRLRDGMKTEDGFPVLDAAMQTTLPGLYVTSLPATRAFGLFFGFTSAVRASAIIVGSALRHAGHRRSRDRRGV